MSDFSRISSFNRKNNFTAVKFGADSPLLEVELNELQQIQNETHSDFIRQVIPSGFMGRPKLDFNYMETHPNVLRTCGFSTVNVDGTIIVIPPVDIKLHDNPSHGAREDLVFLECWTQEIGYKDKLDEYGREGAGGLKNNIQDPRVGVETSRRAQFKYRFRIIDNANSAREDGMVSVMAQGACVKETGIEFKPHSLGVYKAEGSELLTLDNCCYAIPMFKIQRRNTSEFSPENANGGNIYENEKSEAKRPDGLFSNIIYERDVNDLRHDVSVSGYNYDKLLTENFDKFLRGELQKKRTAKVYLGVPKTPMDEFVQFYASFDGDYNAEVGGMAMLGMNKSRFLPSPTGLGLIGVSEGIGSNTDTLLSWTQPFNMNDYLTMDLFIQKHLEPLSEAYDLINLSESKRPFLRLRVENGNIVLKCDSALGVTAIDEVIIKSPKNNVPYHVRVIYDFISKNLKYYINGKFVKQLEANLHFENIKSYSIGAGNYGFIISDFSLSSVSRNDNFKLPKDFIEGYSTIAPTFNGQRKIYSEAVTLQQVTGLVDMKEYTCSPGITNQNSSMGKWTKGDTIIVKAKADELITGHLNSDSILARLTNRTINNNMLIVDDTSKIDEGDTVILYNSLDGDTEELEVVSVDSSSKTITVNKSVTAFMYTYMYLIDSTTTSMPRIFYMSKEGEPVPIKGVWTGVGSATAKFELGENEGLESQDVQIDYGLFIPRGSGVTQNIFNKTLGGEINGKPLKLGKYAVVDDFAGKVKGQMENPNTMYVGSSATLMKVEDVAWKEEEQSGYNSIMALGDKNEREFSSKAKGERAQAKFTFNLIAMIEQKFGKIQALNKLEWIKNNIAKIDLICYGRALNESNKIEMKVMNYTTNSWDDDLVASHESHENKELRIFIEKQEDFISKDGTVNVIVYSGKAIDEAVLSIDYITCKLQLNYIPGMDVLVPSNPRRDAGKSGVIMIRKNTKEVRTYFNATKEDGLVVYGEYTELCSPIKENTEVEILAEGKGFLASDLSSAVGYKQGNHHYMNPLYMVHQDKSDLYGEFGFGQIPFASDSVGVNIGATCTINESGVVDHFTRQYGINAIEKPLVGIVPYLVNCNGELKLLLFSKYSSDGTICVDNNGVCMLINLEGRPLAKKSEGIKRASIIPTAWKTKSGVVEGYLNEDGQIIATYQ